MISRMLEEGLDVYIPLIDDFAIDVVVRKADGSFIEIQIKARSKEVKFGDAALFAAITHDHRANYYFVFYSHRLDKTWIMSSEDLIKEATRNKSGINRGKRTISLNGKSTRTRSEHANPRFDKYLCEDFSLFR